MEAKYLVMTLVTYDSCDQNSIKELLEDVEEPIMMYQNKYLGVDGHFIKGKH